MSFNTFQPFLLWYIRESDRFNRTQFSKKYFCGLLNNNLFILIFFAFHFGSLLSLNLNLLLLN